jgi:hypothetical protein
VATIGIAAYALRVRLRRTDDPLHLGTVDEPHGGLYSHIKRFFESLQKAHDDAASQLLQRVVQLDSDADTVWGLVESGEYGYAAEGIDVKTLKHSYKRKPLDAELIPFYFRIYLPAQNDMGIMLLERHGPRGIFHALSSVLRDYLKEKLPDHVLDLTRLVPAEVMSELLKGGVRAIQITTYRVPSDIADKYRFLGNLRNAGTVTVEFKAKKKKFLFKPQWLKAITGGKARILELPADLGPGRIHIQVDYRGKSRTIDLANLETIAPYVDATSELKLKSGHPTYKSINGYCVDLLEELLTQLGKA